MFYEFGLGLGFLATTRLDQGPRVHPICPVMDGDGLYAFIVPGPKLRDLERDGRYALHSETFPPPNQDDAFYVTGTVVTQIACGLCVKNASALRGSSSRKRRRRDRTGCGVPRDGESRVRSHAQRLGRGWAGSSVRPEVEESMGILGGSNGPHPLRSERLIHPSGVESSTCLRARTSGRG